MIRRAVTFMVAAMSFAATAQAEVVYICWQGDNGFTMAGRMEFPDALSNAPMITEAEVTAFVITGYLDGRALGRWDAAKRRPDATWYLRYFPQEMRFPVNGEVEGWFDQGWNADGDAMDCGAGGFGFNAGNYAQDFCLNGRWIEESGMPPPTPFYAMATPPANPDCSGQMMMMKQEIVLPRP